MAAPCSVVSSSVRIEHAVSCQTGRKPGLSQQGREWPLMCFERFLKTPLSPSTSRRRCLKTSLLFFFPCHKGSLKQMQELLVPQSTQGM